MYTFSSRLECLSNSFKYLSVLWSFWKLCIVTVSIFIISNSAPSVLPYVPYWRPGQHVCSMMHFKGSCHYQDKWHTSQEEMVLAILPDKYAGETAWRKVTPHIWTCWSLTLTMLLSILDSIHHLLHNTITRQRSIFIDQLLSLSYYTNKLRKLSVLKAIWMDILGCWTTLLLMFVFAHSSRRSGFLSCCFWYFSLF